MNRRALAALFACASCSNSESAMSAPAKTLSPFTPLEGGFNQAIAHGEPLVTLGGNGATWWDGKTPVTVELPGVDPYGSRWKPGGKQLRVGLGTLDLAKRAWVADPAFASLDHVGPTGMSSVSKTAWFADAAHVAVVLEAHTREGGRGPQELAIVASDGKVRGRASIDGMVTAMIASADRVLVVASKTMVVDLDGKVIATPDLSVTRVSEGADLFAATLAPRGVALLRPADGSIVAKWDIAANDAVPVPHGIVVVEFDGTVHVGCVHGNAVQEVAKVVSGARGPIVQRVGDKIVLAGGTAQPVWIAAFANPCH
jgi:hypothetical protein